MPSLSLAQIVPPAYYPVFFHNCRTRYLLLKGGRNTGKSYNMLGIMPLLIILTSQLRNVIMFRENDVDNADSTYTKILQAMDRLHVRHLFVCTKSPLKITRKLTGQIILFRGCNEPTSITSIEPPVGYWSHFFFEEASQLTSYEEFSQIDGSLRIGTEMIERAHELGEEVIQQIVFAFNAWDIGHWLHTKFFEGRLEDDPTILERDGYQLFTDPNFNLGFGRGLTLHISSYKCNTYMSPEQKESIEELKGVDYSLYLVWGLGCWGNTTEGCYPNWNDDLIYDTFKISNLDIYDFAIGVDVGISDGQGRLIKSNGEVRSATTAVLVTIDSSRTHITVVEEFFHTNIGLKVPLTEPEIQRNMCETFKIWLSRYPILNQRRVRIFVDSASPGFRQTLRDMAINRYGLHNFSFEESTKLKIHNRINFTNYLMAYKEFHVASTCTNLIREIKQAHKGPNGEPRGGSDHALDAYEYASTMLWGKLRRFKSFKFQDGDLKKVPQM